MRKVVLWMLALVGAAGMEAATTVKIDSLYYSLGTTTATVVSDQSTDKSVYSAYISVRIPATVYYNDYTYPVVTIGTSAFENCSNLQSVTLPNSVTAINQDAFYNCTKLGSINLPEGLTTIGQRAFWRCNLSSVTIPSTMTSIGSKVFQDCPLTTVVWNPVNCSINTGEYAPFYSSGSTITSFTFGDQVQTIPAYLCRNLSKIDTIVLPPSVTALGTYSFAYCSSLKAINLPVTQKSLPSCIFEGCSSLERIEFPATLTTIGSDAFYNCTKLAKADLHEGMTAISSQAFYNCKIDTVIIPKTMTTIGSKAFNGCPLKAVVWNAKECSIGTGEYAPFYSAGSTINTFTFGDSVKTVPAYLCRNLSKLDTIVLPPSVTALGTYSFAYCTSLKAINLPATQKSLPSCIFEGCSALETIELPATLTSIGSDAFYNCKALKKIHLHEGLTAISSQAFYNCKIDTVIIPSTMTTIGNKAFNGCLLKAVEWNAVNCTAGTGEYAPFYSSGSTITSFTFGENVQTIPGSVCKNMSQLDSIALPASVTSIGTYAFAYCTGLKRLAFPEGIKTVASSVLEGCSALQEVVIPASVTSIGSDAFYNCTGLLAIRNYAIAPQSITARTMYNVNKQTCILYVPMDYIDLYRQATVWKDFLNITGVTTELQFDDQIVNVTYLKQDSTLHYIESQNWEVPHAPYIDGFTFVGWRVEQGMLEDGIVLRAVYRSDSPTNTSDVVVNPNNKAQKLIRDGNVYVLYEDRMYTITGYGL